MNKSDLERAFETYWRQIDGPQLEAEYKFHPKRRWRFDFCHRQSRIAIELEGGTWTGGRHVRGSGFERDCEKYNAAALLGWRVFRLTGGMLHGDPVGQLAPIKTVIEAGL